MLQVFLNNNPVVSQSVEFVKVSCLSLQISIQRRSKGGRRIVCQGAPVSASIDVGPDHGVRTCSRPQYRLLPLNLNPMGTRGPLALPMAMRQLRVSSAQQQPNRASETCKCARIGHATFKIGPHRPVGLAACVLVLPCITLIEASRLQASSFKARVSCLASCIMHHASCLRPHVCLRLHLRTAEQYCQCNTLGASAKGNLTCGY